MINSVSNNFVNTNVQVSDSNKETFTVDKQVSDLPPKEIVNKLDSKDLNIKDQVIKLADQPPIDQAMVDEIKIKVEQGRYPIDIDVVTEKLFESFQESLG